jgi:hypothetical protein
MAHDLEEVFWHEDADGKWHKRTVPAEDIKRLIADRSSEAVRAARDALVALPGPSAGKRGRGRKRKIT